METLSCDGTIIVDQVSGKPVCSGNWVPLNAVDLADLLRDNVHAFRPDPETVTAYLGLGVGVGVTLYGSVFAIRALLSLLLSQSR